MADRGEELLKKPLYVFDLPHDLLATLLLKTSDDPIQTLESRDTETRDISTPILPYEEESNSKSASCQLCRVKYLYVAEQRHHVKSDLHNYNLKQKVRGGELVSEDEFEKLVGELDESLSGSGSTSESDDGEPPKEDLLSSLLKRNAKLSNVQVDEEALTGKKRKRGAGKPPLLWFSASTLPENTSIGIYRALFTNEEQVSPDMVGALRLKQLRPVPTKSPPADSSDGVPLPSTMTSPSIFMCMIGGGHFAGMIVSLAPKVSGHGSATEQRQAIVIAHKTFHRYTTRRKQGGAQSSNDAAKGAAHSAGSSIRRYNEIALGQDIHNLLSEWRSMIENAQLIFVRATGSSNRHILFGPYDGQVLRHNDPRNRVFPFSTRRATQSELMRAFVELTRVKTSHVDEKALAAAAAEAESQASSKSAPTPAKPSSPKPTKEEEEALFHTSQIQALIRRSKAPALLSYLTTNAISSSYTFHPPSAQANHHAPMPLHLAASTNNPAIVLSLLTKAGADPTLKNDDGRTPFDLSGERATRDAFRVARHELGEEEWNWGAAHVPAALSRSDLEERERRGEEVAAKAESERRKAEEERLRNEGQYMGVQDGKAGGKGSKGFVEAKKTAEEKREEEGRGMSTEMRMRMERERRARAAEARLGKLGGGGGGSGR
ncbi:uncharacterized protein KY384_000546 [Bacidia gigantensis]|uniref:uncharacterized protein n=1 Tax=Bacidia gigantensis TaxID=2732470 RepID=UPI001D0426A2|nr:uncharacterized protein KY384_000546 [Bacidia gigantensis]KAG8525786.1 hypothetical protein KY384_000546 [Bacidia gigantensis]